MTKQVETQLIRTGREHPVWVVNVKVDGRSVEMVTLRRKQDGLRVMAEMANKYR